MCSNSAILDNLECYMDDLVDCFEDFVKKSLILISFAIATIVAMMVYILKVVNDHGQGTERPPDRTIENRPVSCINSRNVTPVGSKNLRCARSSSKIGKEPLDHKMQCCKSDASKSAVIEPLPVKPSLDERVLRDIGFSCSKAGSTTSCKKPMIRKISTPRCAVASLPTCKPKQHQSPSRPCTQYVGHRSCCSMCCQNDDRQ